MIIHWHLHKLLEDMINKMGNTWIHCMTLKYTGCHWNTLGYTRIHWATLEYTGWLKNALDDTGLHMKYTWRKPRENQSSNCMDYTANFTWITPRTVHWLHLEQHGLHLQLHINYTSNCIWITPPTAHKLHLQLQMDYTSNCINHTSNYMNYTPNLK